MFGKRILLAVAGILSLTAALPASAQVPQDFRLEFPPVKTMSPQQVNLQTGRFEFDDPQFSIGPLSVNLRWSSGIDSSVQGCIYNHTKAFPTSDNGNSNLRPDHPANGIGYALRGSISAEPWQYYNGTSDHILKVRIGEQELHFFRNSLIMHNQAAIGWKLAISGSDYVLTSLSGDVYTFSDHPAVQTPPCNFRPKALVRIEQADGHRLDYSYGANAELRRVTSNRGYAILFDYDAGAQAIISCGYNLAATYVDAATTCAAAPVKTRYTLGTVGSQGRMRVTSVTDTDGGVAALQWPGTGGFLTCVTFPNSPTCRFENSYGPQPGDVSMEFTAGDQVRKQVMPNGAQWTYVYNNGEAWADAGPRNPGEVRYTWGRMIDPDGGLTSARFDNGYLGELYTPDGTTRTLERDTILTELGGLLSWETTNPCPRAITFPEGNKVSTVSDGNCRVLSRTVHAKPGSGLADITTSVSYPPRYANANPTNCNAASPKLCDKPLASVDARGNQTDYVHDPAHGQILSETGPAVNGIRPQTRYAYTQRYARVRDSAGNHGPVASPVWLLTRRAMCKTTAASGNGCAGGPSDEVVTLYDYGPDSGPNNLLLRGVVEDATGLSLRTCYGYDWQGNRISETKPLGTGSSCP